ncbi:MAG TPA: L-histidine N(alpha)-methyltransferase [Usitatibacter sp.]|jgi:dimethylhistidine N-methyltransferase|nr:L-histidine N(alpha)-methyltransferase [Usitatibacter sp.]
MPDDKPAASRIVDRSAPAEVDERAEVVARLRASPATIAPRYFYDELGCALYGAICQLPEYYPTRTEVALFQEHRGEIADAVGRGRQFVDLGAGDCCKAQSWLPFLDVARYVAVDIAAPEIQRALDRMAPDFPAVEMVGVVADFAHGLPLDGILDARPALFFYPGSSIGNFTPDEAVAFLARVRAHCVPRPGSGLLIGVDAKKGRAILDAAYDDSLGVTAAFNRNMLAHVNRRFGFDFRVDAWEHRGFYNEALGRIEMHLQASAAQAVHLVPGIVRTFAAGERIHTENSYKYRAPEFEALLHKAGFAKIRRWASPGESYFVFYAT